MKTTKQLTFSPAFLRILYGIAALNAFVGSKRSLESFFTDQLYKKDFISPYLLAKAMLAGVNPYLPLPELARIFMGYAHYTELNHPTPHPPAYGLLVIPFTVFGYEWGAALWFLMEIACLLASVCLLIEWWGARLRTRHVLLGMGLALGWTPIVQDLWFGQVSIFLLALLLSAYLAFRAGKDGVGGALLGLMIAIKVMAWPMVAFLVLRRRWRGVMTAGAAFLIANLLAAAVAGFDFLLDYYLRVGTQLAGYYRGMDSNLSAWGWGLRLFAGSGDNFQSQPLWQSAMLARWTTAAVPMLLFGIGLWIAWRARQFDTSIGVLILIANLISPIAWAHYSILAAIPLAIVARKLWQLGWPQTRSLIAFGLFLALSVTQLSYAQAARWFAIGVTSGGTPIVPFWAGLLTLIPALAWLGLIALVWRLDPVELTAPETATVQGSLDGLREAGCMKAV